MTRALSFAFGLLMVAAGAVQGDRTALGASAVALVALAVGLVLRVASTLAVVATAAALGLSAPSPVIAAIAGVAATIHLVLRHSRGPDAMTVPTMVGALGLTAVAVLGTTIPLALPWVPLLAPLAVVTVYGLVLDGYVGRASAVGPLR